MRQPELQAGVPAPRQLILLPASVVVPALLHFLQAPLPANMAAPGVCILARDVDALHKLMCQIYGWKAPPWKVVAAHLAKLTTDGFKPYRDVYENGRVHRLRVHFVPAPERKRSNSAKGNIGSPREAMAACTAVRAT